MLGHRILNRLFRASLGRTATPVEAIDERLVLEQLVDVRPQIRRARPSTRAQRLVGAEGEAQHPLLGVVDVVRDLLERLRGDGREGRVGRLATAAGTAPRGRAPRTAAARSCGRSRRWAARTARRCGTRARRASRPGRPRCVRMPCRHSAAASGRAPAGRVRCCRARRPLRARGRGRSTSRAAARGSASRRRARARTRRRRAVATASASPVSSSASSSDVDRRRRRASRPRPPVGLVVPRVALAHRCFTPSALS